jgi:hypothetical protein
MKRFRHSHLILEAVAGMFVDAEGRQIMVEVVICKE